MTSLMTVLICCGMHVGHGQLSAVKLHTDGVLGDFHVGAVPAT